MKLAACLSVVLVAFLAISVSSILDVITYEEKTAADKLAYSWNNVKADATSGDYPSVFQLAKLFIESMSPTMDFVSDEFPEGRSKLIHAVGSHGKVVFKMYNNPYTGLFQGSQYGIIRLSSAAQPDSSKALGEDTKFVPGVGFKLFRDGVPSANFMVMNLLGAQTDSWNFFKHNLTNHLSSRNLPLAQTLIKKKFETVSSWAAFLGLSHMAAFDEKGASVASPNFPHQLLFEPDATLQKRFPDEYKQSYLEQLTFIAPESDLYTIYAIPAPGANPEIIGKVILKSKLVPSLYGDTTMFLKHQRFEEDLALRPQWVTACPTADSCPICPFEVSCDH